MTDLIKTSVEDQVLTVEIHRPERKNALTHAMYDGLRQALETGIGDANIRCILIRGQDDCFTAGNDLGEFAAGMNEHFSETPVGRFLNTLATCPTPVIAAVNGPAVGIGTTMLLHCDLVYAGDNARLQMPFVTLGLCPEGGSSLLLPQWLGRVRASELLLLGEPFSAQEAYQLGLINRVCPSEQTLDVAREAAAKLVARPAAAIRQSKAMINELYRQDLPAVMNREGKAFAERLESPEAREAFTAFREKRSPDFSRFD